MVYRVLRPGLDTTAMGHKSSGLMNPLLHYSKPPDKSPVGNRLSSAALELLSGRTLVFQEGNALVHMYRCVQTGLHGYGDGVAYLMWCPQSPGLNIIECFMGFLRE
ncbi:hypothetical protein TNCV_4836931 [Trichonephila clavipes]|nr:hypothetical protein TNCV_4836931 [Trichonephila clavipes]